MYIMYYWTYNLQKCKTLANNNTKEMTAAKLYQAKEITPDGNSNTQEQIKRTRNNKQEGKYF